MVITMEGRTNIIVVLEDRKLGPEIQVEQVVVLKMEDVCQASQLHRCVQIKMAPGREIPKVGQSLSVDRKLACSSETSRPSAAMKLHAAGVRPRSFWMRSRCTSLETT